MLSANTITIVEALISGECHSGGDFTSDECLWLHESFNVRFLEKSGGIFCYYSSKPGKGGLSATRMQAFGYMLTNLGFRRNKAINLIDDLTEFFNKV